MDITKDTEIEYMLEDKNGEIISMSFPIEYVEGSVPNFYQQLREALSRIEDFDLESSEIIGRRIVMKEDQDESNIDM